MIPAPTDTRAASASTALLLLALCPAVFAVGPKLFTGTIVVGVLALVAAWLLDQSRSGPWRWAGPTPGAWLILALLGWCLLSPLWSLFPDRSLDRLPAMVAVGATAAIGLTAAGRLSTRVDRTSLFRIFAGLYAVLLGTALVQLLFDLPLLHVLHAVGLTGDTPVVTMLNRCLTFLVLSAWPLLAAAAARGRGWLALPMLPILAWVLALGESLAASVALIVGLGVAGLALLVSQRTLARGLTALVLLVVLVSPWLLCFGPMVVKPGPEFLPITAVARLEILALFANPLETRPILGWGLDTATKVPHTALDSSFFEVIDPRFMSVHPHNNVVEIWVELGLVGVALVGGMALLAVRWIARRPTPVARATGAAALASVLVIALTAYGVWQEDWLAQVLFTTLLFLLWAPLAAPRMAPEAPASPPGSWSAPPEPSPVFDKGTAVVRAGPLLWRFVRRMGGRAWPWMVLGVAAMGLVAAASAMTAWLMQPAVDRVLAEGDRTMMWVVGLGLPAAFALKGVANYVQRAAMIRAGLGMVAVARKTLFAHLLTLDAAFFRRHTAGDLTSRLIVDLDTMRTVVSSTVTALGRDVATLVGLLVTLLAMDWELTLLGSLVFPLLVLPVVRLGRAVRGHTTGLQETMGRYDAALHQTFEGVRVVKVFGDPVREAERMRGLTRRLFEAMSRTEAARARIEFLVEATTGLAVVAVVLFGGYRVIAGESTAGTFFAFVTALILAYRPIKKLGHLNATLQEGVAALVRLFAVLDTPPGLVDRPNAPDLPVVRGAIRLDAARVRHDDAGLPALDGVTLDIPAGQTVALVGPSGAGKSTLLNLIARQLDPDTGRVLVDGIDIRTVTRTSLWRQMALVTQDVTLFEGTVRENILYGAPDVNPTDTSPAWQARVEAAARAAEAHDFIQALPQGYDTPVGEAGGRLSGGQRQRIAIARAMLKDAPILLLDEATAALDRQTEQRVQDALTRLGAGRTTVVVAHRLATVRDADLIHVLDRGRVVESGTHAALMAAGGLYARLWASQGGPTDAGATPDAPAAAGSAP